MPGLFASDEYRSVVSTQISKTQHERKLKMSNGKKWYMTASGLREEKGRKKKVTRLLIVPN